MSEAQRQLALLQLPPGPKGSGRQRNGAAMHFHRLGRMSDAALEVYRILAAHDREDPRALLAAQGVSHDLPTPEPADCISFLVAEVDRYLASLSGPGVGEVRTGLARWADGPALARPQASAVVAEHLPVALTALASTHPGLASANERAAPGLHWQTYDGYDPEAIGMPFCEGHASVSLVGEAAHISAVDFDLGLFLIAPHLLYRDHHHAAPELYAPLTGPHGWRFGPDRALILKPAHQPVWNPPLQPHRTKVGPLPFLALFGRTRDVQAVAQVIPASDWPALEALRLTSEGLSQRDPPETIAQGQRPGL